MSDKLCRENGLSVVVPGKGSKGKSYAEYQAEKVGASWKGKLKITVDTLIPQVASFEELLQRLQAAGYEIKPGKYISCRAPGQERFTRLKTLGADYTEEAIKERIEGKRTKAAKAPKEQRGVSLLIDIEGPLREKYCWMAGTLLNWVRSIETSWAICHSISGITPIFQRLTFCSMFLH